MKTNDYILTGAVVSYSALFYRQNAGINFLLFTVVLVALLLLRNRALTGQPKWWWAAGMALLSAACVFIHSSALSIIANVISLILLSALSFSTSSSALFSIAAGFYSIASAPVYMIIDWVNRAGKSGGEATGGRNYKWLGILIVLMVAVVFFQLYKTSNPLFAQYTRWINFDFLTPAWFFFTLGGFFLLYPFFYPRRIPLVSRLEDNFKTGIDDTPAEGSLLKRIDAEKTSLITLFVLLNAMLLLINFGDVNTLLLGGQLPAGVKHSDFVHNGVGNLILSIVIADGLIIYFLRGPLNFVKGNRYIKALILLWIVQNILMLISTSFRNQLYIAEYTLTYKRIGVYLWLFLAIIGLLITGIKVYRNKSNWYLIKTNVAVWVTALSLSAAVDWDLLITRYNLQHKAVNDIDYYYLFSLSSTNIPEMIEFCKKKLKQERFACPKTGTESRYYYSSCYPYMNELRRKIDNYLYDYTRDWRSFDLRDKRILKSIYNQ